MPYFLMAQCPNVPEICDNGIDDDCDGLIDCYDPDCGGIDVCDGFYYGQGDPECSTKPDSTAPFAMREAWRSTVQIETRGTATVGDLDGDGYPEVVAHTMSNQPVKAVYILDGLDGSVQTTIPAEMSGYSQSPSIADINRDGFGEVYFVDKNLKLRAYDHEGNALAGFNNATVGHSWTDGGANSAHPCFADFNGDGIAEIYMGNQVYNSVTGALIGEPTNAANVSQGAVNQNTHLFSAADDVLPDGFCADCSGPELICGNVVYSVNVSTGNITEVSTVADKGDYRDGKVALADWDGDGGLDVIVSTQCCGSGGAIYIWDPRTQDLVTHDAEGNPLNNNPIDAQNPENTQVGLPSIGDFDGDGYLEMAMAGNNELFMIDGNGDHVWEIPSFDISNMTTATAFDFNGDGSIEVVYRDERNLYIINGSTGAILVQEQCGSATRTDLPVVADVDADGEAEIICMCSDVDQGGRGYVRVYESANDPWMPTRRVWNTHTYSPTYVNDDLTIPDVFQNKALVDGQDIYLSQTNLISETGTEIYPSLPDLIVEVDSIVFDDCLSAFGEAYITICNEDFPSLVYDFDISYFDGDPTSGGILIGTSTLNQTNTEIVSSSCISTSFSVPTGNYDLYVVANDDGSDPINAPTAVMDECDEANNIHNLTVSNCDCTDTDDDGVCDGDDLDDDNDGILDQEECPYELFVSETFNTSGGTSTTFDAPAADEGFQFDVFTLDNSFNLNINGVDLVPGELQFQTSGAGAGQSFPAFESDMTLHEQSGNDAIWQISGDANNPVVRLIISKNGNISLYSRRSTSSALEKMVIRPSDPQFNAINWDVTGNNTVILSQYIQGATNIEGTGYGRQICKTDTDGDGIINSLDTDADGDGCLDAQEGGGSFLLADTDDGELTGGVDADGIPIVATSSGQSIGSSVDENVVADECECDDSDGDGVCDVDDLDDDNDGILDRDECQISDFNWSGPPTVNGKVATGTINGIGYTYTSSIDIETTPSIFQHGTFPTDYVVPNTTVIKNRFTSQNTIVFDQPIENPMLLFSSIGGLNAVPVKFAQPIEVLFSDGPLTVTSTTEITGHETDLIIRINGTYSSISFDYLADENYVNFTFGADFLTYCDTDADGTPDYLDTDSDDDGCDDAIEGGGSFVFADVDNGELTGGFDLNGVPLVAAGGQDVGTSANPDVLSGICSKNLIDVDTFYVCLGDSVLIETLHQIEPIWTGDSLYEINDSTITVFPIQTTRYNLESFLKRADLLQNSDFENATISGAFQIVDAANVPGWSTTATDNKIEVWTDGFLGHPAYSGTNFVELNANMKSALHQDVPTTPGESLKWGFAHRGRNGAETMQFQVGPVGGPYETIGDYTDDNTSWGYYSGLYKVPDGQTTTRFYFSSTDPGASGNLIDATIFEALINQYDSIVVIVNDLPEVDLGNDSTICDGETIEVTALTNDVTYSWNTLDVTSSIEISGPGEYSVEVTDSNGCVGRDTVNVEMGFCFENTIAVDTLEVCKGDSVTIEGLHVDDPLWMGTDSMLLVNDSTAIAYPLEDALYFYGERLGYSRGANIITNGNFESGATGFTSQYDEDCTIPLKRGGYCVNASAKDLNAAFEACGDHTSGSGKMMNIDAAEVANVKVWCQTVTTDPNTTYEFSAWVTSVFDPSPPILQFQVNGDLLGSEFNVEKTTCNWQNFGAVWASEANTSVEICLINQNTAGSGNDFAIDDISFAPIYPRNGPDSIVVIVHDIPIVDLGDDKELCSGDSTMFDAQNSGSVFEWSNNSTDQIIMVSLGGDYDVEITNLNGCKAHDTVSLKVNDLPVFDLGNDTAICEPETLIINGGDWEAYLWRDNSTSAEFTADTSQMISVLITDTNGCESADSLFVHVNTLPIVDLGNDTTICIDETLELNAKNTGLSYNWSTGEITQIVAVGQGTYEVEVYDSIGCASVDSISVDLEIIPDPFRIKEFEFCEGDSLTLGPDDTQGFDVEWPNISTEEEIVILEGGTYLSRVSGEFCEDEFELVTYKVDTPDVFILNKREGDKICFDFESIQLEIRGEDTETTFFDWSTGETETVIEITEEGNYNVIASNHLCQSHAEVFIEEYCPGNLYIPNSFTPNEDGLNDVFSPVAYNLQSYQMFIFNRWGQLIYETIDLNSGWDGAYKENGNVVQIDVYIYQINYSFILENGSLEKKTATGTVTVLK